MKKPLLLLCTLLGLARIVVAFSGTIPPTCDAHEDFGCDVWNIVDGVVDRLNCTEEVPGIMDWAKRAVHSEHFSLRAGDGAPEDDATSYTPGEYTMIHLRTLSEDKKYRGLLLYAVNEAGEQVGDWSILDSDKYFWAPWAEVEGDPCQKAVLHTTAEIKPYHSFFRFLGPPAGTGPVTFVALVKNGDANTGEFWYPNVEGELTLSERSSTVEETDIQWILSEVGQTCNEACEAVNRQCDSSEMEEINSREAVAEKLTTLFPCAAPLLSGCSDFTPSTGSEEFCYYKDPTCTMQDRPTSPTECTSSSTDEGVGQLFCACAFVPTSVPTPTPSEISSSSASSSTVVESEQISGQGSFSPLLGLVAGLLLLVSPRSRVSFGVALVCVVLALSVPVKGHNWVNSPSRVLGSSTSLPCPTKRSLSPAAQVARNQFFEVEWATGHGGRVYFVLIRAEDSFRMTEHHWTKLDAYQERAIAAGFNLNQDPLYQKYHRAKDNSTGPRMVDFRGRYYGDYEQLLTEDDELFFERPITFFDSSNPGFYGPGAMWKFAAEDHANDRITVGFEDTGDENGNDAMPWILGVWRFQIEAHLPKEVDVARIWIPQGLGLETGEYTLQYYWRGYGDCVDISYLDRDEPVADIYGSVIPEPVVVTTRIDHCIFPDPQKMFGPPMLIYKDSIDACRRRCIAKVGCNGLNIFPATLASSIYPGFSQDWNNHFHRMMNDSLYAPDLNGAYSSEEAKETLRQAWMNLDEDAMLCLPIMAREGTDTLETFISTNDPEDSIFYGTCYEVGQATKEFIGYNLTDNIPSQGPWKFNDKCIDCDQQVINNRDVNAPLWSVSDTCVHCDREPSDPPVAAEKPEHGGMHPIRNGSCWAATRFFPTCSADNCQKAPQGLGWIGSDTIVGLEECAEIARQDPLCSNIVTARADGSGCTCQKSLECCLSHGCRSQATPVGVVSYEVDMSPPDPECATGTMSTDGTGACCSGTCGACRDEPGSFGGRGAQGFCCSTCIFPERSCLTHGPPCYMPPAAEDDE